MPCCNAAGGTKEKNVLTWAYQAHYHTPVTVRVSETIVLSCVGIRSWWESSARHWSLGRGSFPSYIPSFPLSTLPQFLPLRLRSLHLKSWWTLEIYLSSSGKHRGQTSPPGSNVSIFLTQGRLRKSKAWRAGNRHSAGILARGHHLSVPQDHTDTKAHVRSSCLRPALRIQGPLTTRCLVIIIIVNH